MIDINYGVVFAAAVASMVTGAVWYVAFGKLLTAIRPLTPAEEKDLKKQQGPMFGVGFLLTVLMGFVLYYVVTAGAEFFHISQLWSGVSMALAMYAGFVVPVQATHIIFGNYGAMNKKLKLFAINTGGQLASIIAMGAVIGWLA